MSWEKFGFYNEQADFVVEMKTDSVRLTVTDKRFPNRRVAQIEIQNDRLAALANFFSVFAKGSPRDEIEEAIRSVNPTMRGFPTSTEGAA